MKVFLSYSRLDSGFVDRLDASLTMLGFDVWTDRGDFDGSHVHGGPGTVVRAIRDSDVVVLVLSPDSTSSEIVERELVMAAELDKRVVVVLQRGCVLPEVFRLHLAGMHIVDFSAFEFDEGVRRLATRLGPLQPASYDLAVAPAEPIEPPPAPMSSRGGGWSWSWRPTWPWSRRRNKQRQHVQEPVQASPPEAEPSGDGPVATEFELARTLRADVVVRDPAGDQASVRRSFARGRDHDVWIWIGHDEHSTDGTVTASHPLAEDAVDHSPQPGTSTRLTVTLAHGDDSSSRDLDLPADRSLPSTRVRFGLFVGSDARRVIATVIVRQGNRVVQQAVLVGDVGSEPDDVTDGVIELSVQCTADALEGSFRTTEFDASITAPAAAGPRVLFIDGEACVVSPWDEGLRPTIDTIAERLFATARDGAGGLVSETWPELVRFLAMQGTVVHRWLEQNGYEALGAAGSIQLNDADPTRPLPLEFVYDRGGPDSNAEPCAGWAVAIETGNCPACRPEPEPLSATICPLGFWGLSKIIERQTGTAGVRGDRSLRPLVGTLLAASEVVREADFESTRLALEEAARTAPSIANSWDEVALAVSSHAPGLIVMMPHQVVDPRFEVETLEIGGSAVLRAGQLLSHYVRRPDGPDPIVLLLGCRTANSSLTYLNFVGEFRSRGAALVIGTTATVLGQDVAPIAQCFIRELARASIRDDCSIELGELLRAVRRRMIAEQNAAAFALIAFGDADLVVTVD